MNTDIEELRLLSLDVAEIFYARSCAILEPYQSHVFDATQMVALVYEKSFNFLQADQDIAPSTRVALLKSLCNKYSTRMFKLEFSGPGLLSMPKMTESFVEQVWGCIEKSYLRMVAPNIAPEISQAYVDQNQTQTIEVQSAEHTLSPAPAALKRKSF